MNTLEEMWCFHHQIGEALSVWAVVEYQLHIIPVFVMGLTDEKDRRVFYNAYTGIENFRSKVAFVDRTIAKGVSDQKLIKDWKVLSEKVLAESTKRNHLVHWGRVGYPACQKSGRRFALEPTYRDVDLGMRLEPPHQEALCLIDINVISQGFYHLVLAVTAFARRVGDRPEDLLLKSVAQPVRRLTIRQLEDRMRVVFGRQPRPSRKKS